MQDADSIPGWDLEIRRCFTGKYPSVRSGFSLGIEVGWVVAFFCPQVNCLHPCHKIAFVLWIISVLSELNVNILLTNTSYDIIFNILLHSCLPLWWIKRIFRTSVQTSNLSLYLTQKRKDYHVSQIVDFTWKKFIRCILTWFLLAFRNEFRITDSGYKSVVTYTCRKSEQYRYRYQPRAGQIVIGRSIIKRIFQNEKLWKSFNCLYSKVTKFGANPFTEASNQVDRV